MGEERGEGRAGGWLDELAAASRSERPVGTRFHDDENKVASPATSRAKRHSVPLYPTDRSGCRQRVERRGFTSHQEGRDPPHLARPAALFLNVCPGVTDHPEAKGTAAVTPFLMTPLHFMVSFPCLPASAALQAYPAHE